MTPNRCGVLLCLGFFVVVWCVYITLCRPSDPAKAHLMGGCLWRIPERARVLFPFVNRNRQLEYEACLDRWSLGHFSLYLITGALFPGEYAVVAAASVACETFEYFARYRAKLSDLFVNLAGYAVGSLLHGWHPLRLRPAVTPTAALFLLGVTLAMLACLYTHRRRTLRHLRDTPTTEEFRDSHH